jgi:hypothetical protein
VQRDAERLHARREVAEPVHVRVVLPHSAHVRHRARAVRGAARALEDDCGPRGCLVVDLQASDLDLPAGIVRAERVGEAHALKREVEQLVECAVEQRDAEPGEAARHHPPDHATVRAREPARLHPRRVFGRAQRHDARRSARGDGRRDAAAGGVLRSDVVHRHRPRRAAALGPDLKRRGAVRLVPAHDRLAPGLDCAPGARHAGLPDTHRLLRVQPVAHQDGRVLRRLVGDRQHLPRRRRRGGREGPRQRAACAPAAGRAGAGVPRVRTRPGPAKASAGRGEAGRTEEPASPATLTSQCRARCAPSPAHGTHTGSAAGRSSDSPPLQRTASAPRAPPARSACSRTRRPGPPLPLPECGTASVKCITPLAPGARSRGSRLGFSCTPS